MIPPGGIFFAHDSKIDKSKRQGAGRQFPLLYKAGGGSAWGAGNRDES